MVFLGKLGVVSGALWHMLSDVCISGSEEYLPCLDANIKRKEQDDWMMNPSLNQPAPHTVQAEGTCTQRDLPPKTTEVFKSQREQSESIESSSLVFDEPSQISYNKPDITCGL